jgi:hypothetical protein
MRCPRCKAKCEEQDNYCANCAVPMKRHIAEMVQKAYFDRRQKAVHNILNVLVKEGCIHQERLAELMKKLKHMYGSNDPEPVPDAPEPSSEKLTSAKRLAERSSAELSVKTESESVPE